MRWGLVPFWAKDIKVGFANINGKAEGTRRPRPWEATQARTLRVPAGRDLWTADRARRSAVRRRPPHLERPHRPSGRRYGRKIGKCKAVDQRNSIVTRLNKMEDCPKWTRESGFQHRKRAMTVETEVARHYILSAIEARIDEALRAADKVSVAS